LCQIIFFIDNVVEKCYNKTKRSLQEEVTKMLGKGLEAAKTAIGSGEGLEFLNFLWELAGIPFTLAAILYYFRKPLKNFLFGKSNPEIKKKFTDPKVNINVT